MRFLQIRDDNLLRRNEEMKPKGNRKIAFRKKEALQTDLPIYLRTDLRTNPFRETGNPFADAFDARFNI